MINGTSSGSSLWQIHEVEIARIVPETPGVATYDLRLVEPGTASNYRFAAGQFNMLYLPGAGEIAISVSDDPAARGTLAHTIREAGTVTRFLSQMQVGSRLGLRGPFGAPWPLEQYEQHDILFVAGGLGLAPLRPAIYQWLANRKRYGQAWLLCGARSPEGMLFPREYPSWAARGLDLRLTVDRATPDWKHDVGVVPLLIDRLQLPRPARTVMFCCGPEVMMRYSAKSALAQGIAPQRIHVSLERNMQCGGGLCGHCQLGPLFVCKDGPVVPYERIAGFLTVDSF